MPAPDITISLCANDDIIHYFDYSAVGVSVWSEVEGNAGWIAVAQESQTGSAVGIIVTGQSAGTSDTFTVNIYDEVEGGELLDSWEVKVEFLEDCSTASDICCTGAEEIVWLNREGGLQNYYFNGVRTYGIEQQDEQKYIDYANVARSSSTGKVRGSRLFTTRNVPQSHIDLLDSLQYSIQAWHLVDGEYLPISPARTSYTKYKTRDKFYTASLAFTYSKPINIQTQ